MTATLSGIDWGCSMPEQPRPASGEGGFQVYISPDAPLLPANLLRLYLTFSPPGEAHFHREHLRLRDGAGRDVKDAFLILSQELWSRDGRRLTVLMEPGRIKRGLGPDLAHGPALKVGERFSIELAVGGGLVAHSFRVGGPMLAPLDERQWSVAPPRAGSLDPVTVTFDRVMDAPICADEIRIIRQSGQPVPTRPSLAAGGTRLTLSPCAPWQAGEHALSCSDRLEDVCGNRLGEALDQHRSEAGQPRRAWVRFTVTPPRP